MKIAQFIFNMFGVNTYIVWDENTREAIIIDPGMINDNERKQLVDYIQEENLTVTHMVNTHFHVDHTFGCDFIKEKYNLPVEGNISDEFLASHRLSQARMFGLRDDISDLSIDKYLNEGDEIKLGNELIKVIHVPGHSPGSIVLYAQESKVLFTGDVLFKYSIGRTDLVQGNYQQLIAGISEKLITLPRETIVYPGHGEATSIGDEIDYNPYI